MLHVEVQKRIEAPRQAVWDVYTDHVSWADWARIGKVRIEREGAPQPNGAGCIRVISSGGISVYEEVMEFEPPRRMTYRVERGGLPIKNHLGEVLFEEHGRATFVIWRCRFESRIPGLGRVWGAIIHKVFRDVLTALGRYPFAQAA